MPFAVEETAHVNVWKNRLAELGPPVGPWLRDLKQAVIANAPGDHPVRIGSSGNREMPLGSMRDAVKVTAGQRIGLF